MTSGRPLCVDGDAGRPARTPAGVGGALAMAFRAAGQARGKST